MHAFAALIVSVGAGIGYPLLFAAIAAEAAGVPVPGETALITAAVAASHHRLHIVLVIAVAAAAAILGDNAGYLFGRRIGRRLLEVPGPLARHRRRVLDVGDPFFARHGPKAVFLGRWMTGLRTWAAFLAGANGMVWRRFVVWNAAGGLTWAATVGLLADLLGHAATGAVAVFGALSLVTLLGALLAMRRRRTQQVG